jgi:hypothetical protein
MLMKDTDGVRWEFARVIGEGAAFKTLFLFDPAVKEPAGLEYSREDGCAAAAKRRCGAAGLRVPVSADRILFSESKIGGDCKYQSDRNVLSNSILAFSGRTPRLSWRVHNTNNRVDHHL